MSFIASNIKSIVSIKVKQRNDGLTDQVSRILVAKVFVLGSLVMGLGWFHDKITCMPPKDTSLSPEFIHKSCWIKGFYVYPQLENFMDQTGYYGIPKYLQRDGFRNGTTDFCTTKNKDHLRVKGCLPLRKQYFNQYQWMPFYVASLAILFYMPYIIFRVVNTDMISLRYNMDVSDVKTDDIIQNYFNHDINSLTKMRVRVIANFFIKLLYVAVNVSTFIVLHGMLQFQFRDYGINWARWARDNAVYTLDYTTRTEPTPGNKMLPTFGLCELHEARLDATNEYVNEVKMICEIQANVLYQYIFIAIWFLLVISITMACVGVVMNVVGHLIHGICISKKETSSKYIYRYLTFRECEYLEFIRRKNLSVYGSVIRALIKSKASEFQDPGMNHHHDMNHHRPNMRSNSIVQHLEGLNSVNSNV